MKKVIIHISDLHVMSCYDEDGVRQSKFNSWLVTENQEGNDRYVNSFCDFVLEEHTPEKAYFFLIISGDLTDRAQDDEFTELERVLNLMLHRLEIKKENILIIPGDHDVNRDDAKEAARNLKDRDKKVYDYNIQKFQKFQNFYNSFFKDLKSFNAEDAITDILVIEDEKILYIGLNSNFHIGAKSNFGYIEKSKLETEFKLLEKDFTDYNKIVVFHHNFLPFYKEETQGQWDKSNLFDVKRIFELNNIKCYIYGNEHTPTSKNEYDIPNISIGSFSMKAPAPNFNLHTIISDKDKGELKILNNFFSVSKFNAVDEPDFGLWDISKKVGQIKSIKLKSPYEQNELHFEDLVPILVEECKVETEEAELIVIPLSYIPFDVKDQDHRSLLEIIKAKNLFHSGHFHWSETSRAHNWIDISKLLNHKEDLLNAKKFVVNIIDKNKLEFDFIIGLGIEGNMLATRASVIKNKDYTFLPYSYRYDDHSEYEKQLNFENEGEYKTILIITDVVHDGRTIRKLIHKERDGDKTRDFFVGVDKIIVISLFYTGQLPLDKTKHFDLLNKRVKDDNFDKENDHLEHRLQFHFVSHIKVDECPYNKDNYKSDCIIVREGLGCIHKFYTEKQEVISI